RLVLLRHVMTGLADEAIGVDVTCRSDLVQHRRDVRGVRDQAAVLHMGVGLAYQPLLIVPGAAAALTCDPLDMTFLADLVGAEGTNLALRPNLDVVVLAATGRARLAAASAFGLRARTRTPRQRPPGRLRFPGVASCGSRLFARRHDRLLISSS